MSDHPPESHATSLWSRARGFLARLFRRAPPEPGRFETGSKFALQGWVPVAPWVWPSRDYLVYVPRGHAHWHRRPLLVLLHGCKQTPEEIAAGTRITELADERDWLVLLPRQARDANSWGCWNWFDQRTAAGKGEAAIVAAQVRAVRRTYGAHPRRMFVIGMSSGGCLAAVLGLHFAKLFAAIGVHSGVACGAASSAVTALKVLASGADADIDSIALQAREHTSARALPLPLCVIHGERDDVVAPRNAVELVHQYLVFNGRLPPAPGARDNLPAADASVHTPLGEGRTMLVDDYRLDGRVVARLVRVTGLGHAWSGGDGAFAYNDPHPPDASALFAAFFALQLRGT
ncbi:MAG: PHB depolymerase family esterase [Pseudomonadota bacterium]|nr:PHB depolymerase family esterase [Pseudomonadota bacterium]